MKAKGEMCTAWVRNCGALNGGCVTHYGSLRRSASPLLTQMRIGVRADFEFEETLACLGGAATGHAVTGTLTQLPRNRHRHFLQP